MAIGHASSRPRLLFAVAEGEYYARHCIAIARSLPDFECLFMGHSWSNGYLLRQAGVAYRHLPWKSEASPEPEPIPPVSEFKRYQHHSKRIPECTWRAYHALNSLVVAEMDAFRPDLVLYFDIEHAICHLVDQAAIARGLPRVGLQPWLQAHRFILHREGIHWQEELQKVTLPNSLRARSKVDSPAPAAPSPNPLLRPTLWLRGGEAILRLLTRATSFYDLGGLSTLVTAKLRPRPWFQNLRTLQSLEQVNEGFVLVTLHQPILPTGFPTWLQVMEYVLLATPAELPIVIRPHPKEPGEELPWHLERTLQKRNIWISRAIGPTFKELIQRSKALITTTSMTGFEALLSGIPVLALGPAFFARPGLARPTNLAEAPLIHDQLAGGGLPGPDSGNVMQFHLWMDQTRVVTVHPNEPETLRPLAHRLRLLATGASSDESCAR